MLLIKGRRQELKITIKHHALELKVASWSERKKTRYFEMDLASLYML